MTSEQNTLTTSDARRFVGAELITVTNDEARQWIDWLTGKAEPPHDKRDVAFALAHCLSGVTWAYLTDDQTWKLSHSVAPDLCPVPTAETLLELRIFGPSSELFIWPSDDGLRGRWLIGKPDEATESDPLRPRRENRYLRGSGRADDKDGFRLHIDRGGAQHWPPATFQNPFSVCHYVEEDPTTGAVRIAATRIVPEATS